jgi:hypothetical protein
MIDDVKKVPSIIGYFHIQNVLNKQIQGVRNSSVSSDEWSRSQQQENVKRKTWVREKWMC